MLAAFEVLVEAGIRLPKTIGQAVSIVGAVIVGQAAVEAKLVSPAVVVIIAITAIASFAMPNQYFSNALRLWRLSWFLSAASQDWWLKPCRYSLVGYLTDIGI